MNTRRAFLKTAGAAMVGGTIGRGAIAREARGSPLMVRDAKIVRIRDRRGGATD